MKDYLIILSCIFFSFICGYFSHDLIIGSLILLTGLLNGYLASKGNKYNYIYGLINYILIGYVAYINNYFGMFFFYIFLCMPLQIKGFINWNKNLNAENNVKVREFTRKNSIIIVLSCFFGSLVLGYILSLIPMQKLPFMDSASNCINLCAMVLMVLCFRESWWLWLINNTIDLGIWTITYFQKGSNSFMMLLTSLAYLVINIYGIIKWKIAAKKDMSKES